MSLLSSVFLMVVTLSTGQTIASKPVSICSLLSAPKFYEHRIVTLDATVESDGIERFVLTDPHCSSKGITLILSGTNQDDELMHAIFSGHPGTVDKNIAGTFTGVFTTRRGQKRSSLRLTKVTNLSVKPNPPGSTTQRE
jgi:hypothetical protein